MIILATLCLVLLILASPVVLYYIIFKEYDSTPEDWWYNIKAFFRNCWVFRKALAIYRPWDSGYIETMAAAMYRDIADHIDEHGHLVRADVVARRARVIAWLLDNHSIHDVEDKLFHKLLDEWWSSRKETELKDGGISMTFDNFPKNKERLLEVRRKHIDNVVKHRNELLLKYFKKYHASIWD